ncbi:MAG: hypothetical protein NTZ09_07765, partial [Candidatus Hydrogenedentes bacterium]|nr:hypothetical protein [Candidatus Hydrogenedentota bacterium]
MPIYVKILGIGVVISLLFASVAFHGIRSRVVQAHYQTYGETALSVALSLSSLLESKENVQKEALDRNVDRLMAAFPNVRY